MKMFKKDKIYNSILSKLVIMIFIISCISFLGGWGDMAEAACNPISDSTLTIRGNSNLTAVLENPGTVDSQNIDATGCDLGIYYGNGQTGSVSNSTIHGARVAGIVNNGANVPIFSNVIYQIGDNPFTGSQYGTSIYVYGLNNPASGDIKFNTIWQYQKDGIELRNVNGVDVLNNTVIGNGPIDYIAQNGIEALYGTNSQISGNQVFGNSYTGANEASSSGIILYGGDCVGQPSQTNTNVTGNDLEGNDIGVASVNLASDCTSSVSSPTKNVVLTNVIRNNGIFNTTGDGPTAAYQAGVSDYGDKDKIVNNSICGIGYTPVASPPPDLYFVDAGSANSPTVSNNDCNDGSNHGNHNGNGNYGHNNGKHHGYEE